jgi:hypothetical protein
MPSLVIRVRRKTIYWFKGNRTAFLRPALS